MAVLALRWRMSVKNFDECCKELFEYSQSFNAGVGDPDAFFEAMEGVLRACEMLHSQYSERAEELSNYLFDSSEQVRRITAFCLLEFFDVKGETRDNALAVIRAFLDSSYGPMHIIWLTWLEDMERRKGIQASYKLRAELTPLRENYEKKWVDLVSSENSGVHMSETPKYPFDSFDIPPSDTDDDGNTDDFPF